MSGDLTTTALMGGYALSTSAVFFCGAAFGGGEARGATLFCATACALLGGISMFAAGAQ